MKREKIYNYFYIVNNLLNGHFYLGVHSTDTLADGYFGSGKILKKAIKSYGKENFELVPLKFFKTRKELMDFEREIVNERFLTYYKGICYNLKRGGEGGCEKKFTDEELVGRRKESRRKYKQTPTGKESQRKYNQTPAGKESHRKAQHEYTQTPAGKESQRKAQRKYYQSPEGKELHRKAQRRYYLKKKAAKLASQATPGS